MQRRSFNKILAMTPLISGANVFTGTSEIDDHIFGYKMVLPKGLQKGDTVGLIAPGSPIKPEKFQNAITNLENLGLKPKFTDTVYKKHGYLAGTDQERIEDFHGMIADPNVKAIWCLRGGYGCTRLIEKLDYKLISKNPKIIIGYSDITALLIAIHKETGLVGFHGPVAISDIFSEFTSTEVKNILFARNEESHTIQHQIQSDPKYALGHDPYVIYPGKSEGRLIGGNLSLLVNLPGTKFAPSYKDKIVFIEDVGEKPYRIDRMLTYLIDATDISQAAGIVLGVFNDCEANDTESSLTLRQVIMDRLEHLKIPCFYGFTFGHVIDICTFPIGIKAKLNTENYSVQLLQQAVK